MVEMSSEMDEYFKSLDEKIEEMYDIARLARAKGFDPVNEPEVNVASDIAGRVEELVGPKGVAGKIRKLSEKMGRDEVAFTIAEDIVNGMREGGKPLKDAADLAIRCALAIKTEGVVSAPLEGISEITIKDDGQNKYLSIYFAGPIRAAGGTTQAYVVLLADHIRELLGLDKFVPTRDEVARYIEEIRLYNRFVNLQYPSTQEELEWVVSHVPIEVTGDSTNQGEVSAHRNLPRVETNNIRGGACLVLNDGVLAKSKKILKLIHELKIEGWDWLGHIPKEKHDNEKDGSKQGGKDDADDGGDAKFGDDLFQGERKEEKAGGKKDEKIPPKSKFIAEVIAGRPIFSHPSSRGGFRIRYGRARNMGLAGYGFHPATMFLTDNFMAVGTQLRVERPGKSTVVMPVDSIEPPVVKDKRGNVFRVESVNKIKEIKSNLDKILFMGDVLVGFGEFLENNHKLVPSPYCEEWWMLEVKKAMEERDVGEDELPALLGEDPEIIKKIMEDIFYQKPSPGLALKFSREFGVSLHPRYIYFWNHLEVHELELLRDWFMKNAVIKNGDTGEKSLSCKENGEVKALLEKLCIPHTVKGGFYHFNEESMPLITTLALEDPSVDIKSLKNGDDILSIINQISEVDIRNKARYFMGMRMGRPEKAKERKMNPPVHVLFPIGHECNNQRILQKEMEKKTITTDLVNKVCLDCKIVTYLNRCPKCKKETKFFSICPGCGAKLIEQGTCKKCNRDSIYYSSKKLNLVTAFGNALKRVKYNVPDIKAIKGMTSKFKVPEPLEKGLLRAKFDVYVYKDGTLRYDTGDCPLTHFTPKEIGVTVDEIKSLGYKTDIKGKEIVDPAQVIELKVQDILLPQSGLKYFYQESKFIDELLVRVYGLEPYYNISGYKDFLGHLIVGLAPHTSAGVVGRIIGFTKANVGYAHTTYHAAKRRNCDGDEDGILLFLDVILNFSRYYLPSRIGAKMDTPLVISNRVVPEEVDGEAHNVDTSWGYSIEFYEKTLEYADPKEIKNIVETLGHRLGKAGQYDGIGFTHPTSNINTGPKTTAYKLLESMEEKIVAQFDLARKIVAVDEADQAMRLIQAHFTPDILGNLRSFGTQKFRCTKCGQKYRRPPVNGKCRKCGNEALVLSVAAGSIKKYLELTIRLSREFNLSPYTQQKIQIMQEKVEDTIFNGKRKQMSLAQFF
ncbi:MAG: DNA polymerase II large subunit [Promethearchaeota archaeon]